MGQGYGSRFHKKALVSKLMLNAVVWVDADVNHKTLLTSFDTLRPTSSFRDKPCFAETREMSKTEREQLSRALSEHVDNINEALQVLDQTAASSLERVSWKDVIQMGDQLSKQATNVGMLWTGETPEVKVLEENMAAYFNMLQGLLLFSHGSTVGAGPTLSSCIRASIKQVVNSSLKLMKDSVSYYGSHNRTQKLSIPQLVGMVWDTCSALKKMPSTNITVIVLAMTQAATSMNDVLREINELKPASFELGEDSAEISVEAESLSQDSDYSCEGDLGNDLSPEEIKIAQLATSVASETLMVIKELIHFIAGLVKLESAEDPPTSVDSLEKLLKFCQGIGVQIDELGACLYPPQELSALRDAVENIASIIEEMTVELENLRGSTQDVNIACTNLRSSLKQLESELGCVDTSDIVPKMEYLTVTT